MSGALIRALLLGASAGALIVCGVALAAPPYEPELPKAPRRNAAEDGSHTAPYSDSLVRTAIAGAMFRASRAPSAVRYDPDGRVRVVTAEEPRSPRPLLTLAGIVWEPEPSAVVEGLPGVEGGKVLRRGDTVSGLRVKRIEPDRVVITGLDSTWNLRVKEPWK